MGTAAEPYTILQDEGGPCKRQGEKRVVELAQQFNVHPDQITQRPPSFKL